MDEKKKMVEALLSDTPQETVMNLMRLQGRDITNKKKVFCDVCDSNGDLSKGGYIIYKAKKTPDFVCEYCWKDYVLPEKPILDTENKKDSFRYGIGRDIKDDDKVTILNPNNTFTENLLNVRANPSKYGLNSSTFTWNVIPKNDNGTFPKVEITEEDKPKAFCCGCEKLFPKSSLKICGKCKLVSYCSIQCQNKDWKGKHKNECVDRKDK
jgi:hypothetical protein